MIIETINRKLGYWEEFNSLLHEKATGHGTNAAYIKVNGAIDNSDFIKDFVDQLTQNFFHSLERNVLMENL